MEQSAAFFPLCLILCQNSGMATGTKREPSPLTKEIAAILREKMAREGIKDQALADATGMSRGQVQKIRTGIKQIDVDDLDRMCFAVGLVFLDVVRRADAATASRHIERVWDVSPL